MTFAFENHGIDLVDIINLPEVDQYSLTNDSILSLLMTLILPQSFSETFFNRKLIPALFKYLFKIFSEENLCATQLEIIPEVGMLSSHQLIKNISRNKKY